MSTAQGSTLAEKEGRITLAAVPEGQTEVLNVHGQLADIADIGNMVAVRQEATGILIRFRSNEQLLAVDTAQENPQLVTYMDDDMNMFYEEKELSCTWNLEMAEDGGCYITLGDLALACRDGKVTLETSVQSDAQEWFLR